MAIDDRSASSQATLAQLRHRPVAHARRSAGRAVRRVPVVVHEDHLRPVAVLMPDVASDIIARGRHDGCGGRAGEVELLTGIEAASSRPVRKIVLIGG